MSDSYAMNEKRELILKRVKAFIAENGGVVKKNRLNELGIDYRRILDYVETGDLVRIKSGYYAAADEFSEEELVVKLFPDALLTLEHAPYGFRLAVDKNTSKSRFKLEFPQILPFYAEPETLCFGVEKIAFGGGEMNIFDRERLVCECLKYEDKMEREQFREGLLSYIRDKDKDIAKLMEYAKERRVAKKAQSMIGVWL